MKRLSVQDESIPAIGLGTWQLTEKCEKTVERALKIGYRHIDTAQAYGNEEEVGRGIQNSGVDRDDIWLTTKLWRDNLEKGKLKPSFEESLQKLGTDYVDLLLIHWPFEVMDLEVVLEQMNELVESGKVRNIGVSNFNINQMERARDISGEKLLTNQVEYHPFLDQRKLLEKCRDLDMMLTAYSPLARGEVIGNSTLEKIGEKYGKTEAQVCLRWLVQQEKVCAIPKASSEQHLRENLDIFDFELEQTDIEEIRGLERNLRKVDPGFAPEWD